MTHSERIVRADAKSEPEFYFSYVLQFDDESFYVGHTNAPASRFTEHAAGQSTATANRGPFRVRMAMPFGTRKERPLPCPYGNAIRDAQGGSI